MDDLKKRMKTVDKSLDRLKGMLVKISDHLELETSVPEVLISGVDEEEKKERSFLGNLLEQVHEKSMELD